MLSKLFIKFLEIGVLSFGGGYAVVSLIQSEIVDKHNIINPSQFLDLVALSQISPGPLAINASTFVGFKVAGVWGATVTTFAVFILPFIISFSIAKFYNNNKNNELIKNIISLTRLCVSPIILVAIIKLFPFSVSGYKSYIIIAIISTIYIIKKEISPILLMIIGGILGYIFYGVF